MPNYCEWCITVLGDKQSLEAVEKQVRADNLILRPEGNLDLWADWQVIDERFGWCDREDHGINPAEGPNIRDRFENQPGLRLCGVSAWSPPQKLLNLLIQQCPQCEFVVSYTDQTNDVFISWRFKDGGWHIDAFTDYGERSEEPTDYIVAGEPVGSDQWNDGHWHGVEFWLGDDIADAIYASLHGKEAAELWRESRWRAIGEEFDASLREAEAAMTDKPVTTDEASLASLRELSPDSGKSSIWHQ